MYVSVYMYVSMYVFIYACIYVNTYICPHIHTPWPKTSCHRGRPDLQAGCQLSTANSPRNVHFGRSKIRCRCRRIKCKTSRTWWITGGTGCPGGGEAACPALPTLTRADLPCWGGGRGSIPARRARRGVGTQTYLESAFSLSFLFSALLLFHFFLRLHPVLYLHFASVHLSYLSFCL